MTTISFTTDYGLDDGYVAACHGVALTIAPRATRLDVTHLVPPGDVRRGARVLAATIPYLPPGSVHVAVVDPGVGTDRRAVVIDAPGGVLVGPDNGLLVPAADALGGVRTVVEARNEALFRHPVSTVFHGRDIFMPVAAHLAAGVPLAEVGPVVAAESLVRLPDPVSRSEPGRLEAEVVMLDRFGNVQLAAGPDDLARLVGPEPESELVVGGAPARAGATFGSVPAGELVVMIDSAGQVAVAVNGGSAADRLGVGPGDLLRLTAR